VISYIIQNPELISELMSHYTLPIKQITDNLDIQRKIIERHRKYIISAVIILNGDFSGLAGYFDGVKEVAI
jgi:RNA polymerase sigma factor